MNKDYHDNSVLFESLNQRDLNAFEFLYTFHRKRLLFLAVYILKDEEAAKDLIHEFFLDFWENRLFENVTSNINAYLSQSIRNRALNLKKKSDGFLDRLSPEHGASVILTSYPLENDELRKQLNTIIRRLPPMSRKVFFLHYVEHMPYADIAQKLKIKHSTIKNHITRALNELRAELKKNP